MLVIGSRGSQLAMWEARWVQERLAALGHESRIRIIKTTGDRYRGVPLPEIGGKGLFTKEIEDALADGSVDLAVHSLKDLPTQLPPGLAVTAVPEREDPRDAIVGGRLADLPQGAKVGTSSLRRAAHRRSGETGPIRLIPLVGAVRFGLPTPCAQGGFRRPSKTACCQLITVQADAVGLLNPIKPCWTRRLWTATKSSTVCMSRDR